MMDIEDILASIDGQNPQSELPDLQELTRAWVAERSSPELLQWPSALIDRMLARTKRQVKRHQLLVYDKWELTVI